MDQELRAWFDREGLMRYAVTADEHGDVEEVVRGPLVAMGTRDEDFVHAPKPDETHYGKRLRDMSMDDYNNFMYRWLEAAAHADDLRCANCGRLICDADDLPDPETWDAIFIEKELVAWMAVHFDCKRWLAKKLKGVHPFDLHPTPTPYYNLTDAVVPEPKTESAEPDTLAAATDPERG